MGYGRQRTPAQIRTWVEADIALVTLDFSWRILLDYFGVRYKARRSGRLYTICVTEHVERTPSCVLHPGGTFHCYGCQRSGDALEFVNELRASPHGSWLSESAVEVILRAHATSRSWQQLQLVPIYCKLEASS